MPNNGCGLSGNFTWQAWKNCWNGSEVNDKQGISGNIKSSNPDAPRAKNYKQIFAVGLGVFCFGIAGYLVFSPASLACRAGSRENSDSSGSSGSSGSASDACLTDSVSYTPLSEISAVVFFAGFMMMSYAGHHLYVDPDKNEGEKLKELKEIKEVKEAKEIKDVESGETQRLMEAGWRKYG
ncbi:hypothetical protein [Paraburkholderia hayleyella]|uniref:hypothetical protein n=1 Tax=Paraburkholderia hayleyella TaxID=2152889 RepID=UPI0012913780|nr:hypothetical protein [Paraburkholderia hayleyella]